MHCVCFAYGWKSQGKNAPLFCMHIEIVNRNKNLAKLSTDENVIKHLLTIASHQKPMSSAYYQEKQFSSDRARL